MKKLFSFIGNKKKTIVLVSGLPRSGTSMMMKMLDAGGLPPLTDNLRTADDDNPRGYYEFERVKKLRDGDTAWLPLAEGKAVKIISALLEYLPADYAYRVIFMRRAMPEILASQNKMLVNRGEETDKVKDEEMAALFEKHLLKVQGWLAAQKNFSILEVPYSEIINKPLHWADRVQSFLDLPLDKMKMAGVVDPELYRQRA